jgi:5'-3' exonuclease
MGAPSLNNATALIDGDILVYRIGFASDDDDEKFAVSRMGNYIEGLISPTYVDDYSGYITGRSNFRYKIANEKEYKGNRSDARKPNHYETLRNYLTEKWGFELVEGEEADDAIGIAAYQMRAGAFCIMSLDKDLDMLRGWHYNFVKDNLYYITEKEAIKNFYLQILTGDRVDNIPGLKGVGPVKAGKLLEECQNERQLFAAVLQAYEDNLELLTERAQLLWIRRKAGEIWTPKLT